MKVACYVRVSTESQIENYSIEEQTERLKAYCTAKGYNNYKLYTDGGYSGGNTNRPALQGMLRDIRNGEISVVVVYKLDRLSRSQKDTLMLIEDNFLANNVDFISINENFDTTTPFGRAMIGMLSVFAQLEKDQITERFTMGRIGRAKAGYYHGGVKPPIGYDYVDGELIINEYEAMQVRMIYDYFIKGYSVYAIWTILTDQYTTKYGSWNCRSSISKILTNAVYIGKVRFKGVWYEGLHTPIIDAETFYLAQERFKERTKAYYTSTDDKRPFKAKELLSGILYCKRCGARYHGSKAVYVCYSRSKAAKAFIKDPACKNKRWRKDKLDALVLEQIRMLDIENEETITEKEDNTEAYQDRLKKIDDQIQKLIDLYQVSGIPLDALKERTDKLQKEKEFITEAMNKEKSNSLPDFRTSRDKLLSILYNGSVEEKRMLISYLIERIDIDGEDLYIKWRL